MRIAIIYILYVWLPLYNADKGDSLGCFDFRTVEAVQAGSLGTVDLCLSACEEMYYRYAVIMKGSDCYCENSLKMAVNETQCNITCSQNTTQTCGGTNVASVYETGSTAPGPPDHLLVSNVTTSTMVITWTVPQAHGDILGYKVTAAILHTHSRLPLQSLEWRYSNDTFRTELVNMQPGTQYNISVQAEAAETLGHTASVNVETVIGDPDPSPPDVQVKEHHGDRLLIHIPEAINFNGPVSGYRIVVADESLQQGFIPEYLKSYEEAKEDGLPYYIAAEIDPYDVRNDFIVGDKRTYNGFYNAPLPLSNNLHVFLGVVSRKNSVTKIRYADTGKVLVLNVNLEEDVSKVVLGLTVAVAIGVVLLLVGVGTLIVLRRRVGLARAGQRCSQSLPLSASEPCIEIENTGYMPEEDERVDHYGNLKRQLWNIPRNFLEVDNSVIIGLGSFGKFVRGGVHQQGEQNPVIVQAIADCELDRETKKAMLHELDLLIKCNSHNNILSLVGICEIPDTLYVVLEDTRQTLKEMLLSSRHRDVQNNKFSLIPETKIIQIAIDIAKGMQHLSSKKILHRRLSCRNIAMAHGTIPKITGFGLGHMQPLHEKPDYTRWTAVEMFKQTRYTIKSDVWSYGCLQWELMTLGATLYPQVATRDVTTRVMRGMRPAQLSYIGDELYQICLQCWQLDLDERPDFRDIVLSMERLSGNVVTGNLSFTYYNDFVYEQYISGHELC